MTRSLPLLPVLLTVGCHPSAEQPPADPPLPEPTAFAGWPTATAEPVQVPPVLWVLCCRMPTPAEVAEQQAIAAPHGPHAGRRIVVRVNPEAAAAFRDRQPLPAGTTVVKEKHYGLPAGPPTEYAVMVKRPPGYDPAGGDWEYAYVSRDEGKAERGRLDACAGCHRSAPDGSGVFRTYLPK